jgi:hypothetical protein
VRDTEDNDTDTPQDREPDPAPRPSITAEDRADQIRAVLAQNGV